MCAPAKDDRRAKARSNHLLVFSVAVFILLLFAQEDLQLGFPLKWLLEVLHEARQCLEGRVDEMWLLLLWVLTMLAVCLRCWPSESCCLAFSRCQVADSHHRCHNICGRTSCSCCQQFNFFATSVGHWYWAHAARRTPWSKRFPLSWSWKSYWFCSFFCFDFLLVIAHLFLTCLIPAWQHLHFLTNFTPNAEGFRCDDDCGRTYPANSPMWRCVTCDYHQCDLCHQKALKEHGMPFLRILSWLLLSFLSVATSSSTRFPFILFFLVLCSLVLYQRLLMCLWMLPLMSPRWSPRCRHTSTMRPCKQRLAICLELHWSAILTILLLLLSSVSLHFLLCRCVSFASLHLGWPEYRISCARLAETSPHCGCVEHAPRCDWCGGEWVPGAWLRHGLPPFAVLPSCFHPSFFLISLSAFATLPQGNREQQGVSKNAQQLSLSCFLLCLLDSLQPEEVRLNSRSRALCRWHRCHRGFAHSSQACGSCVAGCVLCTRKCDGRLISLLCFASLASGVLMISAHILSPLSPPIQQSNLCLVFLPRFAFHLFCWLSLVLFWSFDLWYAVFFLFWRVSSLAPLLSVQEWRKLSGSWWRWGDCGYCGRVNHTQG